MSIILESKNSFLLHKRLYRENSLLLYFFTKEYGLVSCVAKGIRNFKQQVPNFIQLFIVFSGKLELKTLRNWEINDVLRNFSDKKLICAIYLNELLINFLLYNQTYPKLYDNYFFIMQNMNDFDDLKLEWALRLLEKNLLTSLGLGYDYDYDIDKNSIQENCFYTFYYQKGFKLSSYGDFSGNLLFLLSKNNLEKYPNKEQLSLCKNHFRTQIKCLLGAKKINSYDLFYK